VTQSKEPGLGEVARIVGATVIAALAGVRLYAFLHEMDQGHLDRMDWATAAIAALVVAGCVWVLVRTLGEAA
jgi:hypothetical protein